MFPSQRGASSDSAGGRSTAIWSSCTELLRPGIDTAGRTLTQAAGLTTTILTETDITRENNIYPGIFRFTKKYSDKAIPIDISPRTNSEALQPGIEHEGPSPHYLRKIIHGRGPLRCNAIYNQCNQVYICQGCSQVA